MQLRLARLLAPGLWAALVSTSLAQDVPPPPPTPLEQGPPPTPLVAPPAQPLFGGMPYPAAGPGLFPGAGCAAHPRTVDMLEMKLIEQQEATTRHRLDIREQEVPDVHHDLKIDYIEERRVVTEMKMEPYEEVREVVTTKVEEVPSVDCHGHPIKVYKAVPCVQTVKVVNYHAIPVTREVIVRVPCPKHVPKPVLVKTLVAIPVEDAAIRKSLRAQPVHNTVTLPCCPPLPPLPPPAPACPPGGCKH